MPWRPSLSFSPPEAVYTAFRNGKGTRDMAGPEGLTTEQFVDAAGDSEDSTSFNLFSFQGGRRLEMALGVQRWAENQDIFSLQNAFRAELSEMVQAARAPQRIRHVPPEVSEVKVSRKRPRHSSLPFLFQRT